MKKLKYLILLLFVISVTIMSCDTLDEEIISGVTAEYMNTPDGLDAGVNAAYSFLRTYYAQEEGNKFSVFGTDEYTHGGHGGDWDIDKYGAGLNAENGIMWHVWNNFYQAINTCNAVVDRATASEELTEAEKNPKIAEARFLRAHYYFILVQAYGDIPLVLEETQGVVTEATRTAEAEVYNAIIADLEFAMANLPVTQSQFGRATQVAAKHMLALVQLTRGNNSEAISLAKSVINDYGLELDTDPLARYNHDNEQHPEILWSVQYEEDPLLTPRGNRSHLHFRPWYEVYASGLIRALGHGYGRPWIRYRPTGWLLNNFRVNGSYDVDTRFNEGYQQVWYYNTTDDALPSGAAVGDTAIYLTGENLTQAQVDAIEARLPGVVAGTNLYSWHPDAKGKAWSWYTTDGTDNNSINIFPTPWKQEDNKRPDINYAEGSRDLIVYCLSETYLLLAEALLNDGKAAEAATYINEVRERAAYPGKESEMLITADDVTIDFILDERSREFYGEQKRWFDLKRTGKLIERYKAYNPEGQTNDYIQSYHLLRPIPANQLTRVTNEMRQNDGY
ncbi:RagB/SusD family nutrient uptake outer membrane protein [uncultured Draconibacterium sp.]|uniref:RagB/SusD family nutrient uptake outer membrane protein n=1 Tax=uncultured Draconibacterium sp. TaxID=1573823 RepID=UPI002AA8D33E|nr:RagB/SusD family nutrient uptake outer membrane protein [uncultured Draconibacterium sp.]